MFCRRVWQRAGPLARRLFSPASRNSAPVRHMAFGVPGGSTNMTYFVLCGGGLTAAVVYAYKTVNGDTERYEDRLANMNTQAKVKEAPDAAAPVAEPAAAAEEEPSPAEVIIESVPAEPAAEISADEAASEGVAADVVEAVVTEASAEPAEEAAPAAVEEAAPEASIEAAAAETPDQLTAVKILSSSTAEIAAASVGEENLLKAVHQKEAEATISSHEESEAPELASKEAAADVSMEEKPAEEVPTEESPAPAAPQIEEGSSPHEETSAEEAETAQEEVVSSTEITLQNAPPSEEAEDVAVSSEASPQEETPEGETSEETIIEVTQLAAASAGPDLDVLSPAELEPLSPGGPVQKEECCHSCYTAPSAGEEVAPPAAPGEAMLTKEEEDPKHDCKEESPLLEEQNTENTVVLTLQS